MIRRLIFTYRKPAQVTIAVVGAILGFLILLGGLQLFFDFRKMLGQENVNQPQYLVINKEVGVLNTIFGGNKGFDEQELASLKKVKGVEELAPLTSSHFKINLTMGPGQTDMMQGMYMDLFFEAVPDAFVDVQSDDWDWQEGDSLIPIIIPRDYVKLYNFGYAPSQGQPQISETLFKMVKAKITIRGSSGTAVFTGKIAGFSERINTIMAPQKFVDYANEKFANVKRGSQTPSRVIIRCKGQATSELATYFAENGYQTSAESLRNSKLSSFLDVLMIVVMAVGAVIMLLALLSFLLYSQLIMSKSSYELQTLIRIGFSYRTIASQYIKYYALLYGVILIVSLLLLWLLKMPLMTIVNDKGFDLSGGISWQTLTAGLAFALFFLLVNYFSIRRELIRLAKK
jgi:FtsX-like permease family